MKTQDFIRSNLNTKPSRTKWCSSVAQYEDGNFYSYGPHYPLLFKLGKHWMVNTMGYSASTSKHIGWAHQATIRTLSVDLQGSSISRANVKASLLKQVKELKAKIAKGRNGSHAQEWRKHDLEDVLRTLVMLNMKRALPF